MRPRGGGEEGGRGTWWTAMGEGKGQLGKEDEEKGRRKGMGRTQVVVRDAVEIERVDNVVHVAVLGTTTSQHP